MRTFIAGTAITGLSVASSSVVARSSAMPAAILASMFAVAGQTTTRSACARKLDVPHLYLVLEVPESGVDFGFSLSAASAIAVTNLAPPSVSTQVTSPPPLRIRRTSSQDL